MNIEAASIEALRIAREITPARGDYRKQLEATFKMASALTESFSVGEFTPAINCLGNDGDKGGEVIPVFEDHLTASEVSEAESFSLMRSDPGGDFPDQFFSTHNNSPSIQYGESRPELPTPGDLETLAAPSDVEEAARTHGGAA
jgi:hypothetical protein